MGTVEVGTADPAEDGGGEPTEGGQMDSSQDPAGSAQTNPTGSFSGPGGIGGRGAFAETCPVCEKTVGDKSGLVAHRIVSPDCYDKSITETLKAQNITEGLPSVRLLSSSIGRGLEGLWRRLCGGPLATGTLCSWTSAAIRRRSSRTSASTSSSRRSASPLKFVNKCAISL